jgi:hypothetical protein
MKTENDALELLEDLVKITHHGKQQHSSWDDQYEYITVDYEGPYIDEDTGEPDHDCIMYLVNIDNHLSERIQSSDKYDLPEDYATVYGWITPSTNSVDIVGFDNFSNEERSLLVKNISAFIDGVWEA